jgi:hypothetical protein
MVLPIGGMSTNPPPWASVVASWCWMAPVHIKHVIDVVHSSNYPSFVRNEYAQS